MDPRSWTSPQLNEAVRADNEGCEDMDCERLELRSGQPRIGRALVQQQASHGPDKVKVRAASPRKKVKRKAHNKAEDPYNPIKAPDFSIQSPSVVSLVSSGKKTTPGDDRKRRAAMMMEHESEVLPAPNEDVTPAPERKQVRRVPRRNSVLIHRREGGTAWAVQDLLVASVAASPYNNDSEMQQGNEHSDTAAGLLGLPISRSQSVLNQLKTAKDKSSTELGFKRDASEE